VIAGSICLATKSWASSSTRHPYLAQLGQPCHEETATDYPGRQRNQPPAAFLLQLVPHDVAAEHHQHKTSSKRIHRNDPDCRQCPVPPSTWVVRARTDEGVQYVRRDPTVDVDLLHRDSPCLKVGADTVRAARAVDVEVKPANQSLELETKTYCLVSGPTEYQSVRTRVVRIERDLPVERLGAAILDRAGCKVSTCGRSRP